MPMTKEQKTIIDTEVTKARAAITKIARLTENGECSTVGMMQAYDIILAFCNTMYKNLWIRSIGLV